MQGHGGTDVVAPAGARATEPPPATVVLVCRYCGLTLRPRAAFLSMEHCPRCLARRRAVEPLVEVPEPRMPSAGPGS
jgi:hypothetical protein